MSQGTKEATEGGEIDFSDGELVEMNADVAGREAAPGDGARGKRKRGMLRVPADEVQRPTQDSAPRSAISTEPSLPTVGDTPADELVEHAFQNGGSADGVVPAATDFLAAVDGEAGLNMQVRILEADAEDDYDDEHEGAEPEIRVEEADTDPKTIVGMSSDGVPQIVEDVPTSPLPTRPVNPGSPLAALVRAVSQKAPPVIRPSIDSKSPPSAISAVDEPLWSSAPPPGPLSGRSIVVGETGGRVGDAPSAGARALVSAVSGLTNIRPAARGDDTPLEIDGAELEEDKDPSGPHRVAQTTGFDRSTTPLPPPPPADKAERPRSLTPLPPLPSELKLDAKPEAKADAKPEAKADGKSEAKPDTRSEAKPDAKSEAKSDARPEAKSDGKPEAKAEAKPEAKPEAKIDRARSLTPPIPPQASQNGGAAVQQTLPPSASTPLSVGVLAPSHGPPAPPPMPAPGVHAAPPSLPPSMPVAAAPATAHVPPAPPPRERAITQPNSVPPELPLRTRKKRRAKQWFEEIFDDDYLRTLPFLTPRQTEREAAFVAESLGVAPGGALLDLACGYGRHAMELAAKSYKVTGLDLSLPLLIRAADTARRSSLNINFIHGDMREMTFENEFDGAYSMFTSFGYFDDDTNRKVAANLARAIKPGGKLLLDIVNRDYLCRDLPTRVWWQGEGCVVLEEVDFNYFSSRLQVQRSIIFEDGRQVEQEISIRAYSLHEIGKVLHHSGFRVTEVSGGLALRGKFFGAQSRQLIVLAEKKANP